MKPSKDKRDAEAEAYEPMITGTPVEDANNMWSFEHFELQKLNEYTLEPLERKTVNWGGSMWIGHKKDSWGSH